MCVVSGQVNEDVREASLVNLFQRLPHRVARCLPHQYVNVSTGRRPDDAL